MFILVGWLVAVCSLRATGQLHAGAARTSITPDPKTLPTPLGGYVSPSRLGQNATGVHDTCYARALSLRIGDSRAVIVSLDLCFLPGSFHKAVSAKLGSAIKAPEWLYMAATHTHSAPDPLGLHAGNIPAAGALTPYNPALTDWMAERVAECVRKAISAEKPAKAASAQAGTVGLNRNRRGDTVTDDELTCLLVTGPSGKPLAIVSVYAAHPVYYGAEMLEMSGDWSGAYQRQLEGLYPGSVALFLNGSEGDASPHQSDEGMPAEKILVYSAKLVEQTRRLLEATLPAEQSILRAWSWPVRLGAPSPHALLLVGAPLFKATAQQMRDLATRLMPETVPISFLEIAGCLLMGFPGEPTSRIGLAAKTAAKEAGFKRPAVTALTNEWIGYIVTPEQYRAGKYEATMSFYGPEVGERLLAGLRQGLRP